MLEPPLTCGKLLLMQRRTVNKVSQILEMGHGENHRSPSVKTTYGLKFRLVALTGRRPPLVVNAGNRFPVYPHRRFDQGDSSWRRTSASITLSEQCHQRGKHGQP